MANSEAIRIAVLSVWDVKLRYAQQVVDMPVPDDDFEAAAAASKRASVEAQRFAPEDCACALCRHHRRMWLFETKAALRQQRTRKKGKL